MTYRIEDEPLAEDHPVPSTFRPAGHVDQIANVHSWDH